MTVLYPEHFAAKNNSDGPGCKTIFKIKRSMMNNFPIFGKSLINLPRLRDQKAMDNILEPQPGGLGNSNPKDSFPVYFLIL